MSRIIELSSHIIRTISKPFFARCIYPELLRPQFKRAKIALIRTYCGDIV
jgi:hypothetical protein